MAITLFPLLVSNTVSRNIVPGVAKVLENYIMVYGLDSILKQVRGKMGGKYRISNKKVIKMESIDEIPNFLYQEFLDEQSGIWGHAGAGTKGKDPQSLADIEAEARAKEKGKQSVIAAGKDASVRLDSFNLDAITLEPTWMKIDQIDKDGNKTSGVIGVKVIPYAVKSDVSLSKLLMYDKQVTRLQRLAIMKGRQMTTALYRTWHKLWMKVPFTEPSGTVSGDPRKDILLKRSIMDVKEIQSIFALANQAELSDTFTGNAKEMMNLQKMGWGSIVIADDVNRRASFCMKELKGLCSIMPYTMLYQTFSQAKVYEDIEDAKRNASSIFKVKRSKMSKLIGEGIAQTKTEDFGLQNLPLLESEFISEVEYIDENIGAFLSKITPAKLKIMLPKILKGDIKDAPATTVDKIVRIGMKLHPEFRKGYVLAKKVIGNSSPGVSEAHVDLAAITVAIGAALKKGGSVFMDEVKIGIKKFIKLFRRSKTKAKPDKAGLPKEHIIDATFGWIYITTLTFIITTIVGLAGYAVYSAAKLGIILANLASAKLAGVDKAVIKKVSEDWSAAALETVKEQAVNYAPWIALAVLVLMMGRKMLK